MILTTMLDLQLSVAVAWHAMATAQNSAAVLGASVSTKTGSETLLVQCKLNEKKGKHLARCQTCTKKHRTRHAAGQVLLIRPVSLRHCRAPSLCSRRPVLTFLFEGCPYGHCLLATLSPPSARARICSFLRLANTLFYWYVYSPPAPTPASTSGSGGTTPTQCPSQPVAVGEVWNFHACYTEGDGARALDGQSYSDNEMTLGDCSLFCGGFAYFGLEYPYGRECYCGDAFKGGAVETLESECSMLCPGGIQCDYCGAGNRLSVYRNSRINVDPSSSAFTTASSTYTTLRISLHISSGSPGILPPSAVPIHSPASSSITGFGSEKESSSSLLKPSTASSATGAASSNTTKTAVSSQSGDPTNDRVSPISATTSSFSTVPARNSTIAPWISSGWNVTHTRPPPPLPALSRSPVLSSNGPTIGHNTQPPAQSTPAYTPTGSSLASPPVVTVIGTPTGALHSADPPAVTASPIKSSSKGTYTVDSVIAATRSGQKTSQSFFRKSSEQKSASLQTSRRPSTTSSRQ